MRVEKTPGKTTRQIVVLSESLVEEARRHAPLELRRNFNRLVIFALGKLAEEQNRKAFHEEMAGIGADSQIRAACEKIEREFFRTETDGLTE